MTSVSSAGQNLFRFTKTFKTFSISRYRFNRLSRRNFPPADPDLRDFPGPRPVSAGVFPRRKSVSGGKVNFEKKLQLIKVVPESEQPGEYRHRMIYRSHSARRIPLIYLPTYGEKKSELLNYTASRR